MCPAQLAIGTAEASELEKTGQGTPWWVRQPDAHCHFAGLVMLATPGRLRPMLRLVALNSRSVAIA